MIPRVPRYDHAYLEPHFDDVALSCGALVKQQGDRGERVLVVTLFAGNPGADAAVTEFAAGQHSRWGGHADPIAERRAEQRAALTLLGADWRPLEHLDAIYRGDQYLSDEELFGPVKPGDAALVERIAGQLGDVAAASWYAPLGVGNHVDHQLALAAARAAGIAPLLYEDFPYVAKQPAEPVAARLGARVALEVDARSTLDAKVAAIACYRSQIPTLFGDAAAMEAAVRAWPTERYWRRPASRRIDAAP
jgi:LmbE family N-acetylglucosaminyl deacetylase